jgi:uncharacterized membrane protein YedE/YeeE
LLRVRTDAKIAPVDGAFVAMVASALLAGALFGYCAERGGFCLVRALSNLVLMRDATIARAYVLALVVAVTGTWLLRTLGAHLPALEFAEEIPVRPFRWVANLAGGLVFGIGMVLAGGCAGSTWYRIGEGALGAVVVLAGFALGATVTNVGLLAPLRQALQQYDVALGGQPPTLYSLAGATTGVASGLLVLVIAGAAAVWLTRGGREPAHGKWRWPVTGTAVGAVIVLGWYLSSFAGPPVGITFAENTGHLLTYPLVWFPNRVTWGMVLLLGVPLGAGLAAWRHGELAWKLPAGTTTPRLFGGGVVMGVGALIAQGCNITQGLTYASTLAVGSLTAFAAMVAGGWATLWWLYLRK